MSTMKRDDDLVITGMGAATASAYGSAAHWDACVQGALKDDAQAYKMTGFKPAPYLSDRRMLKAVSATDAIGLAAFEGLVKEMGYTPGSYDAERIGVYVGAPPASAFDNEFYVDAMEASRGSDGKMSEREFGKTCMSSRPTTLLVGLPNNVLCYGALILDARGPNSNYTACGLSGQMAVINGAKRVKRGALDMAIAGGFSAQASEPVNSELFGRMGLVKGHNGQESGSILADGAAFVAIERRRGAEARQGKVLATYIGGAMRNDGMGPLITDERGAALTSMINDLLNQAVIRAADVGLIFANASGVPRVDSIEIEALSAVFGAEAERPALATTSRIFGNLLEAGGVMELGLLPRLAETGEVPVAMRVADDNRGFAVRMPAGKPYVLILRATPWGEYSCVLARQETI